MSEYIHMVCVNQPCTEHRHKWHPGVGHCSGCIDESNQGYGQGLFTFQSRTAREDAQRNRCCCRDRRIGATLREREG